MEIEAVEFSFLFSKSRLQSVNALLGMEAERAYLKGYDNEDRG